VLQENFDLTINFDLMMNFDLFLPNNVGFSDSMSVKLVCGRFINFRNSRKNLTLLTFGCPSHNSFISKIPFAQ